MRVLLLAPMRPELAPLVRKLGLRRVATDRSLYRGAAGPVSVRATTTGIGTAAAAAAAERLLAAEPADHVMVVGIAGGVDPAQPIGALIWPERVVDVASGRAYRPAPAGDGPPHGRLLTSDTLVTDSAAAERLRQEGVVGLDMETAAVAAVCERRGAAWSVFRAISDRVGDGTTDAAVLALAGPDGSGNAAALARYLLARPWRIVRLARLARGSHRAADAAAAAAIRACARLGADPVRSRAVASGA